MIKLDLSVFIAFWPDLSTLFPPYLVARRKVDRTNLEISSVSKTKLAISLDFAYFTSLKKLIIKMYNNFISNPESINLLSQNIKIFINLNQSTTF